MALFSRRKKEDDVETSSDTGAESVETPAGEPGVDRPWDRTTDGPWDAGEVAEDDGVRRLDLGSLRVLAQPGMEVRITADKQTKVPTSVTCSLEGSLVQLQVFAAPRSTGIWEDIRAEIGAGLVKGGGTSQEVDGPLGTELRARMPGRASDGRVAFQPARFLGIDGPRWFLRAVVSGQAARDEEVAAPLLAVVRGTVVVRGDVPMPPREALPLTVPEGAAPVGQPPATPQAPTAGPT